MRLREWFRPPRHLLVLFLAVTVVSATVLGWLSWRLLEQDRALENQRIQERLDHAADLVTGALHRRLTELEEQLPAFAISPPADFPSGGLIVIFQPEHIQVHPGGRLLYYPFLPPPKEAPGSNFQTGEVLEFQKQDYAGASAIFVQQARLKDPAIRAGALLRLARNFRKNRQLKEALAVYAELAQMGSTSLGGVPAELLARHASCSVLEELKSFSELRLTASTLQADLVHGRWPLDRASYELYSKQLERWAPSEPESETRRQDAVAFSAAVELLWEQSQELQRDETRSRGFGSLWARDRSFLVIWHSTRGQFIALIAGTDYLKSQWPPIWEEHAVDLRLTDKDGHTVLGHPLAAGKPQAIRTTAETQLPWTLQLASADPQPELVQFAARRRLVLAGLTMMGLLALAGSYFIILAVARELAVASLQSDFVSAVSHEFRTPLTSLRHLTELLASNLVPTEERRRQYYTALSRETERLHRLVESLLNFARMEAGAFEYRFESVDAVALLRDLVAEFQEEGRIKRHSVELSGNGSSPPIHADREALALAVWNLLDNAVKYSSEGSAVWVTVDREREFLAIRVRDQGSGIPASEQKEIFQKFVRGVASRTSTVKGTGIGLAMVQRIVKAHGGKVHLKSEPGRGSTFSLLLPLDVTTEKNKLTIPPLKGGAVKN
jgi:signal transduction histidine kinase